jgi:hypothetical protein
MDGLVGAPDAVCFECRAVVVVVETIDVRVAGN